MVIWKYPLDVTGTIDIPMPRGAVVLDVQAQHNTVVLWALVDPALSLEVRRFSVYGTGIEIEGDPGIDLATVQLFGGSLVLHVFEKWPSCDD